MQVVEEWFDTGQLYSSQAHKAVKGFNQIQEQAQQQYSGGEEQAAEVLRGCKHKGILCGNGSSWGFRGTGADMNKFPSPSHPPPGPGTTVWTGQTFGRHRTPVMGSPPGG